MSTEQFEGRDAIEVQERHGRALDTLCGKQVAAKDLTALRVRATFAAREFR